jgi:N-acetylglucosaminyl-diphospho-decaprenol L-rhamnosyltransferase
MDVVVATSGSRDMVLSCLDHLDASVVERVVVVDDASDDGVGEAVRRRHGDGVAVVGLGERRGLSYAYNRGAERGSSSLVLFLNDDILAEKGALRTLADTLALRPEAVAAAGRLVDPERGETQEEYQPRNFPTLATFVAMFAGVERAWRRNPWTGRHRREPLDERKTVAVEHAPGACLLVRRSAFEAVGGWDEGFRFWWEDVDISRRLGALGPVLYVPTARFRHVGGWSSRRLNRSEVVGRFYGGALRYGDRHFGRWRRAGLGALFLLAGGTRALLLARRDRELAEAYRRVARAAAALALGKPLPP